MTNTLDQFASNGELVDSQHPAITFLRLLGKDPATTYFRNFNGGKPKGLDLRGFDDAVLTAENAAGAAIFFVTGDADAANATTGAVKDENVARCPTLFVEWDDRSREWQEQAWQELRLPEPSAMVHTGGKSVHCYWRLTVPMAPDEWRVLQRRLIEHAGSDPQCKNPSRLMRVPGYRYVDKGTGEVTDNVAELIYQANVAYTVAEIEACLPATELKKGRTGGYFPDGFTALGPPRTELEIKEAAAFISERVVGGNTYPASRNALCGCSAAFMARGMSKDEADEIALELLAHKWPDESTARQVISSATTRSQASFWAIAREHGYQPSPAALEASREAFGVEADERAIDVQAAIRFKELHRGRVAFRLPEEQFWGYDESTGVWRLLDDREVRGELRRILTSFWTYSSPTKPSEKEEAHQ